MAAIFDPATAFPLTLSVHVPTSDANTFALALSDDHGHDGAGIFAFDPGRPLPGDSDWGDFLGNYLNIGPSADELDTFGRDLFKAVVRESPSLSAAWEGSRAAAGSRPLFLTVELGPQTERFASLPLELLADDHGFLFRRPEMAVRRAYRQTSARTFERPAAPRVLFAWACPPHSGSRFDAEPHGRKLLELFGDRLERLDHATLDDLGQCLQRAEAAGEPFHYLHLLAHGFRDIATGGVCLATDSTAPEGGTADYVDAQRLASVVAGHGLELAFLCSCQTAVAGGEAFNGVGQQLLSPHGGDLACVIATQANLPVRGSAELSGRFYQELHDGGEPATALAAARRATYQTAGHAWSVPVLLTRPQPRELRPVVPQTGVAGLPLPRATYLDRAKPETDVLEALRSGRLVSLVGLPGIGKTELGREAARRAVESGLCQQVIYREAHRGLDTALLRGLLATGLGLIEPPADDVQLAAAFDAAGDVLLVIDNAEDLMLDGPAQGAFRDLLDGLLQHAARLRVLLTTRWPVEATWETERQVDVPQLTLVEAGELLQREVRALGIVTHCTPIVCP